MAGAWAGFWLAGSWVSDTLAPLVTLTDPTRTRMSRVSGQDAVSFTMTANENSPEWQIRLVPAVDSPVTAGSILRYGKAGETNLFGNPSVEDSDLVANQAIGANQGATVSHVNFAGRFGTSCLRVDTTTTTLQGVVWRQFGGTYTPATQGQTFSATFWVRAAVATTLRVAASERTAAGALIADSTGGNISVGTEWMRIGRTHTMTQATAGGIGFKVVTGTSNPSVTFYLDGALLQSGAASNEFFDGSMTPNTWSGVANRSSSIASGLTANTPYVMTITDDELMAVAGEGNHIIKGFAKDASGNWSV